MPKLWVTANSESKAIPPVARHIEMESYVWPDGSGAHRATYQLDRHGDAEIKLVLPAEAQLASATLDGQSLDVAKPTAISQPVLIRLPAQAHVSKLSLYLETRGPTLSAGREIIPPLVLEGLSYIAGDWTIWLPEEYAATGAGLSADVPTLNWRERLFGVLGRSTASQPFNPFRLADENISSAPPEVSEVESAIRTPDPNTVAVATAAKAVDVSKIGWRSYHESFTANEPAPIVVLHPPAITTWLIALLLASYLFGRRIRHAHPELFVVALAVAAAAGLLLPIARANLAAGAVIGLLLSLIAGWPRRLIPEDASVRHSRPNSAVVGALVIVVGIGLTTLGHAEPPSPNNVVRGDSPNKIYRLLIPADEQGRPAGDKYYVSDEFLRFLVARSSDASQNNNQWLLNDAAYTGELTEQMGKGVVAGRWWLTFSIETLARDTTVVLPLCRSEADWNDTAMLDGVPMPIEWRDAGRTCAIQISEPGHYLLALSCIPKTAATGNHNQIALTVPPIPGAHAEVRYPDVASGVVIADAFASASPSSSAKTVYGELDQTNRLDVRWSHTDKAENGVSGFALSELRWLHVTPTDLEVTVKYVLEGGARRPDSIAVAYDDRWQLLTTEKSLNAKSSAAGTDGQRVIRVPISTQSTDRQEISLRLRLAGPPALGSLRLPSIGLASASPNKRWLAISSDPALECEISDASAVESTSNEFFAKWGDADPNDPPQMVLSNYEPRSASTMVIRPRETEPIVDESLSLAADLATLHVNYEARTTPGMPGAYRVDLSVPSDLSIDEIAVTEADRSIPLRWSRSAKNRVSVFFGQQISKPYRLVLTGTTPIDASGKAPLPHVSTLATEDATQKIRVYRNEDVHVEFEGLASTTDPKTDVPGPPPSEWSARPVATCYLQSGSATARIVIRPNKQKLIGDALTVLTRENGSWWMNYRCQLSVDDGELDVLRLRVPNSCAGPFEVQSAAPVTTALKSLDDQTSSLSVRFAASVAKRGSVDLRIRSPLKPPTGTGVSVPAITIDSLAGGRRFICVPDVIDTQVATWSEAGVRQATLPTKLRTGFAPPASGKTVEVVNDPFQVASRPSTTPELSPQIRLADTAVVADDLGAQRITTRLILASHGLSDCTLQLPPNQSLIAVELDDRPAVTRQLSRSQWQVALGALQLPQSLEVVSRSPANDANDGTIQLLRPTLLARDKRIPAEISLWSFAHPRNSATRVVTGADEVTEIDQSALRFDRLVSIAEAAKSSAADLPPPDGYNWFQTWSKLLDGAHNETQQIKIIPQVQRPESQVSHTAEDQINQAAARLAKWMEDCRKSFVGEKSGIDPLPSGASAPPASIANATSATEDWSYYVAEGGNDRLTLHLQPLGPTSSQIRIVGLPLIATLMIAVIWLMRQPAAVDALCRWPHACGVLIGIAYWAWLWPSWLGILIAAVSMWMGLRFHWPGRCAAHGSEHRPSCPADWLA